MLNGSDNTGLGKDPGLGKVLASSQGFGQVLGTLSEVAGEAGLAISGQVL